MTRGYFSNYCGLGGSGSTQHATDEACKEHDELFAEIQKLGGDPYLHYVQADTQFLKRLWHTKTTSTKEELLREISMGYAAFKHLLPKAQMYTKKYKTRIQKERERLGLPNSLAAIIVDQIAASNPDPSDKKLEKAAKDIRYALTQNVKENEYEEMKNDVLPLAEAFITPEQDDTKRQKRISPAEEAAKKFPWTSLSNKTRNRNMSKRTAEDMETDDGTYQSNARSDTRTMLTSEETEILWATPSYQLQDTHTTILPVTFHCSMVLNQYIATDLTLRMNCIQTILNTNTLITNRPDNVTSTAGTGGQGIGEYGAAYLPGRYNSKIPFSINLTTNTYPQGVLVPNANGANQFTAANLPSDTRWTKNEYGFPTKLENNKQPVPFMRDWYNDLYQFKAVIGCEYEIYITPTKHNTNGFNNDVLVASHLDSGSNTNGGDIVPYGLHLNDIQYLKNIKYTKVRAAETGGSNGITTIKGRHKCGSATGMVANDGEIKRWIKTGQANDYHEDLHLMFMADDFNTVSNTKVNAVTVGPNPVTVTTATGEMLARTCLNLKIVLKYLVQFKDIGDPWKYRIIGDIPTPETANDLLYSDYSTKNVLTNSNM